MPRFEEVPYIEWEPEVLKAKSRSVKRNAIIGAAAGIVGILLPYSFATFFFTIVLGLYAIYSGRDALVDINVYGVERTYRRVAQAALMLGGFAIILRIVLTFLPMLGYR